MTHLYVTCRIYDSFVGMTCMSHPKSSFGSAISAYLHVGYMTHLYVTCRIYDSFVGMTWLPHIYRTYVTASSHLGTPHSWLDSFICGPWAFHVLTRLLHMILIAKIYATWVICMRHESPEIVIQISECLAYLHIGHDPFTRVTWLPHMYTTYVTRSSSVCSHRK